MYCCIFSSDRNNSSVVMLIALSFGEKKIWMLLSNVIKRNTVVFAFTAISLILSTRLCFTASSLLPLMLPEISMIDVTSSPLNPVFFPSCVGCSSAGSIMYSTSSALGNFLGIEPSLLIVPQNAHVKITPKLGSFLTSLMSVSTAPQFWHAIGVISTEKGAFSKSLKGNSAMRGRSFVVFDGRVRTLLSIDENFMVFYSL